MDIDERFQQYYDTIDEQHHPKLDFALERGYSPKSIIAFVLYEYDDEMTVSRAADEAGVSKATISNMRNVLEDAGLI